MNDTFIADPWERAKANSDHRHDQERRRLAEHLEREHGVWMNARDVESTRLQELHYLHDEVHAS